jgi:hypothetical protein
VARHCGLRGSSRRWSSTRSRSRSALYLSLAAGTGALIPIRRGADHDAHRGRDDPGEQFTALAAQLRVTAAVTGVVWLVSPGDGRCGPRCAKGEPLRATAPSRTRCRLPWSWRAALRHSRSWLGVGEALARCGAVTPGSATSFGTRRSKASASRAAIDATLRAGGSRRRRCAVPIRAGHVALGPLSVVILGGIALTCSLLRSRTARSSVSRPMKNQPFSLGFFVRPRRAESGEQLQISRRRGAFSLRSCGCGMVGGRRADKQARSRCVLAAELVNTINSSRIINLRSTVPSRPGLAARSRHAAS